MSNYASETSILRDELSCSICLNIYSDPVTLRCGHNFCRGCIDRVWGTQQGVYSCPECREEFQERPQLPKNITLCNIIERCMLALPEETADGVFCSYCVHAPVAAVKSCLHCEASLCEEHLRAHSKSPEHILSEPSNSLHRRKCSVHKKVLEYYCTQDGSCICVTCCLAGKHTGHKVEQLIEASNKKMETLKTLLTKMLAKRAEIEDRVQSLKERRRTVHDRTNEVTETVSALFDDIRRQLGDLEKKVLSVISEQQEQVSSSVSDLIQQLQVKKDMLSRKMSHIERLCDVADPLMVLQDREDFCDAEEVDSEERQAYDEKIQNIGELDEGLMSVILHTGLAEIVSSVKVGTEEEMASGIVLDMNTACDHVEISHPYKCVNWNQKGCTYPITPEKFQVYPQVLSTKTFSSGKQYFEWELHYYYQYCWSVGVCYPSMDRKGDWSCLGFNNKSWCLWMYEGQCSVIHDSKRVYLPQVPESNGFRMCLDYEAGQVSFYELCDPIRHLHTFTANFTEPLHVACYLWGSSSLAFN